MAKLKLYRHYKGGHYVELGRALMRSTPDGEWDREIVYYRPISKSAADTYARDATEFEGSIVIPYPDGRPGTIRVPRFQYLGDFYAQ